MNKTTLPITLISLAAMVFALKIWRCFYRQKMFEVCLNPKSFKIFEYREGDGSDASKVVRLIKFML